MGRKKVAKFSSFTAELSGSQLEVISQAMDVSLSELRELMMDWEAWRAVIQWVAKSWTQLSD